MELKDKTINFLGDSITYGEFVSCKENTFTELIKKECELKEARNYGISGTKIAHQLGFDPYPGPAFSVRYKDMADADIVMVMGGTNDYAHGDAPFGEMSDRTIDTFYGALHALAEGLLEKYIGKPVIFMTPTHRMNDEKPSEEVPGKTHPLIYYVNAIKEVAVYYGMPVLDLYSISGLCGNNVLCRDMFMEDGLHPNDRGHRIIADRIKGFLVSF